MAIPHSCYGVFLANEALDLFRAAYARAHKDYSEKIADGLYDYGEDVEPWEQNDYEERSLIVAKFTDDEIEGIQKACGAPLDTQLIYTGDSEDRESGNGSPAGFWMCGYTKYQILTILRKKWRELLHCSWVEK